MSCGAFGAPHGPACMHALPSACQHQLPKRVAPMFGTPTPPRLALLLLCAYSGHGTLAHESQQVSARTAAAAAHATHVAAAPLKTPHQRTMGMYCTLQAPQLLPPPPHLSPPPPRSASASTSGAPASSAAAAATSSAKNDLKEVEGLFAHWNAACQSGDPKKVASLYWPNAVLLPTLSNSPRNTPAAIED